jgi:hypothetical protein
MGQQSFISVFHVYYVSIDNVFVWSVVRSLNGTNIMFLDIIHGPVFIWKHCPVYFSEHNILGPGFCLHLQVKPGDDLQLTISAFIKMELNVSHDTSFDNM